jgi:hypothetical protein
MREGAQNAQVSKCQVRTKQKAVETFSAAFSTQETHYE